jgi:glycine cleavage system H lipoate-binding protein
MSILFTLATFLLFITLSYLRSVQKQSESLRAPMPLAPIPKPQFIHAGGFEVPKGYSFHPGHTWATAEEKQRARVGLDSFTANLLGTVDNVELPGLNRWVRQGQRVCKFTSGEMTVELVSPVEGIVVAVNPKLREDPGLVVRDPYGEGWLFAVHSPDLVINLKNLLHGDLVRAWLRNSLERVNSMATGFAPALAQDGGLPVAGVLARVDPALRRQMINEFFLS